MRKHRRCVEKVPLYNNYCNDANAIFDSTQPVKRAVQGLSVSSLCQKQVAVGSAVLDPVGAPLLRVTSFLIY